MRWRTTTPAVEMCLSGTAAPRQPTAQPFSSKLAFLGQKSTCRRCFGGRKNIGRQEANLSRSSAGCFPIAGEVVLARNQRLLAGGGAAFPGSCRSAKRAEEFGTDPSSLAAISIGVDRRMEELAGQ